MQKTIINANEANQRLDKYLAKYLKEAPKSFFYKMMRKKNIVLNGKKATGSEKLKEGDEISFFLSDETIAKFRGAVVFQKNTMKLDIVYEDKDVLLINKPAGVLSQKAKPSDVSLVEYLTTYLIDSKAITMETLKTFHPATVNRLDRNTSGLTVAGKSLLGLQTMSELFKNRTLDKYYLTVVKGTPRFEDSYLLKGYLKKDEKQNKVTITKEAQPGSDYIETSYRTLCSSGESSLLQVHLITGKPHQIRAHLAYIGNPIAGDAKYGNPEFNMQMKQRYGLKHQLLHSWCLKLYDMSQTLPELSDGIFYAPVPEQFYQIMQGEHLTWEHGIRED